MELEFHELELHQNISKFLMVLEFHELEYHGKLDFVKIEFQKSGRLLNISQKMIDCIIFSKKVVFGHFDLSIKVKVL